ncbi:MAG: hypothetical protein C4308_10055 [Chitinophagaceae bacterium]
MEQMNLHKQRLYALIAAGVGVISIFLPWWRISWGGFGGYGGFGGFSINGFHELGILAFFGFVGAGVVCFLGDKTKPFAGQFKMIAAGAFALAALITLIQFLRLSSSTSFGIWLSLLAGIAGVVIVYVLKPEQLSGTKPPAPPAP